MVWLLEKDLEPHFLTGFWSFADSSLSPRSG